jgi:hypothetical protein
MLSESIYKTAAAATNAPIAPTTEPASMLAAFVEAVIGAVEVPEEEPVALEVVLRPPVPVADVLLNPDPELTVGVAVVGATPVPEALPMPLPAPSDGDKPPPDEARTDPVATDWTDDATLDFELAMLESELAVEDGLVLELLLLLLLEATAEQDRSYNGVVLRGLPGAMPKLGLVWAASVSSIVNHQVLVLPNRGHPTSSQ